MKKSILYFGMAIILLSWNGNYLYFSMNQLDKPIMLKHYYQKHIEEETTLELHYLINRNQKLDISNIHIPGLDYVQMIDEGYPHNTYRHYVLKKVYVKINQHLLEEKIQEGFIITEIEAYLTNGERVVYDVGQITLGEWDRGPFDFRAAGGSSDGSSFDLMAAEKDLTLHSYEVPFLNKLSEGLTVYINKEQAELVPIASEMRNGHHLPDENPAEKLKDITDEKLEESIFPLGLGVGELLNVEHQFSFREDDPNRLHFYYFEIKFIGETKEGHEFKQGSNLHWYPHFSEKEIKEMIKEERRR
jgi:hypothetical protein